MRENSTISITSSTNNQFYKFYNKRNYAHINERIIVAMFKIERGHKPICVIGVYGPEEGRDEEIRIFYDELRKHVNKYNKTDHLLIL